MSKLLSITSCVKFLISDYFMEQTGEHNASFNFVGIGTEKRKHRFCDGTSVLDLDKIQISKVQRSRRGRLKIIHRKDFVLGDHFLGDHFLVGTWSVTTLK